MKSQPHRVQSPDHGPVDPRQMQLRTGDWALGLLTLPLLLFALMAVTSAWADSLMHWNFRLRMYVVLLALEVAAIAAVAWMLR